MALTKKTKVTVFTVVGVLLFLGVAQYVNWFVYPFSAANPNFKDVEAVYSKMQIPSTWTKTGEGSNKGIAGRQCGIESDGCFGKSATYKVPANISTSDVKNVFLSAGCVSVVADREEQKGGVTYTDFECSAGGLRPWGTLKEDGQGEWSLSIGVSSH